MISAHHASGNPQSPIPRLQPWSLCHPCRPLSMQSPASRRHQTDCPLTIGYCFLAILHQFPAAIILNSTQDYHWSQETDTARANNNRSPGSAANTRSILDSIWLCHISANPVFMRMHMIWEGWHSFWHFKNNDLTTKYTDISKWPTLESSCIMPYYKGNRYLIQIFHLWQWTRLCAVDA